MTETTTLQIQTLPKRPGIYLMRDQTGEVLYVGKAKDIRSRVRSYFSGGDGRPSVPYLVEQIDSIETIVTEDERQALILESDLIKKYKPRYNVRLKDDKAYIIIRIDLNQQWPRIEVARQFQDDGAKYFGPFAFGYEVRTLLEIINRMLPLRTCSDRILNNRVRPCLEYQIKRCAGPCCLAVDTNEYMGWVKTAMQILEGKVEQVVVELEAQMLRASESLEFEEAARIRDRLSILSQVNEAKPYYPLVAGSRDALALKREGPLVEFCVLMVRSGRLQEAKTFGFEDVAIPDEELWHQLISQYYANIDSIPDEILVPIEIEDYQIREELYQERTARDVKILTPKRGHRARLLGLAQANADENFTARFSSTREERLLDALCQELELSQRPRVIDCIDVSHFQGGATVSSVVSFKDGKIDKNRYRRFHLTQEGKADDFASMRETALRHLSRQAEEGTLPDLLVIDGGPGQLSQVLSIRAELGLLGPEIVALAKKRPEGYRQSAKKLDKALPERIYLEGRKAPVVLPPSSAAMMLLERIRNEAHRSAISFHRTTRSRRNFRSSLDSIPGIGPKRRNKLLRIFGSISALKAAGAAQISEQAGIPAKLAERISRALASPKIS